MKPELLFVYLFYVMIYGLLTYYYDIYILFCVLFHHAVKCPRLCFVWGCGEVRNGYVEQPSGLTFGQRLWTTGHMRSLNWPDNTKKARESEKKGKKTK